MNGNWRGWTQIDGVQSGWFQLDGNMFQMQFMITNGNNAFHLRIKYNPTTSWDGIGWISIK